MLPDQGPQYQGHDSIEQHPCGSILAATLEIRDDIEHAFCEKKESQGEREAGESHQGMRHKVEADDEIEHGDEQLPRDATCTLRLECVNKLKAAANGDEPGDDNHNAQRRSQRKRDGQTAKNDEQNSPRNGATRTERGKSLCHVGSVLSYAQNRPPFYTRMDGAQGKDL